MSPRVVPFSSHPYSFPRVSGDEPPQLRLYGLGALFSPREWG